MEIVRMVRRDGRCGIMCTPGPVHLSDFFYQREFGGCAASAVNHVGGRRFCHSFVPRLGLPIQRDGDHGGDEGLEVLQVHGLSTEALKHLQ